MNNHIMKIILKTNNRVLKSIYEISVKYSSFLEDTHLVNHIFINITKVNIADTLAQMGEGDV